MLVVVEEDTNILILLCYHADLQAHDLLLMPEEKKDYKKHRIWDIKNIEFSLGIDWCNKLWSDSDGWFRWKMADKIAGVQYAGRGVRWSGNLWACGGHSLVANDYGHHILHKRWLHRLSEDASRRFSLYQWCNQDHFCKTKTKDNNPAVTKHYCDNISTWHYAFHTRNCCVLTHSSPLQKDACEDQWFCYWFTRPRPKDNKPALYWLCFPSYLAGHWVETSEIGSGTNDSQKCRHTLTHVHKATTKDTDTDRRRADKASKTCEWRRSLKTAHGGKSPA